MDTTIPGEQRRIIVLRVLSYVPHGPNWVIFQLFGLKEARIVKNYENPSIGFDKTPILSFRTFLGRFAFKRSGGVFIRPIRPTLCCFLAILS